MIEIVQQIFLTWALIWYMWHQFSLAETSIDSVLLFIIETVQNICFFGYLVFFPVVFKSLKNARKKYNIAKLANIFGNIFHEK